MKTRTWAGFGIAAAALLAAGLLLPRDAGAQAGREVFDFEGDVQGFTAIQLKDGALTPDAGATLAVSKETVKVGAGSLGYAYKSETGVMRALAAEVKLPAGAQGVDFWIRSQNQTALMFTLREMDGSTYQLAFYVPAFDWSHVQANFDELTLGDGNQDENAKLDPEQVNSIGLMDYAPLVATLTGGTMPHLLGDRRLWLDDLKLTSNRAPQTRGPVKVAGSSAFVVDNFEADAIRWISARVIFANQPTFEIFPADISLKILAEAAAPGAGKLPTEPGGRGLRFGYKRADKELFGMVCALDGADLDKAERLRLNLRVSQKSLLMIGVKEKDESEYRHLIMPENSEGWQSLDLALNQLALGDDSKDENNMLDPGQIKEISILDASGFLGAALGLGDTTLDLDAVSFALKP